MYLINTDQGYIKGELHNGLQFVYEKEEAGVYKEVSYQMIEDLHNYYSCEEINLEQIN